MFSSVSSTRAGAKIGPGPWTSSDFLGDLLHRRYGPLHQLHEGWGWVCSLVSGTTRPWIRHRTNLRDTSSSRGLLERKAEEPVVLTLDQASHLVMKHIESRYKSQATRKEEELFRTGVGVKVSEVRSPAPNAACPRRMGLERVRLSKLQAQN